MKEGAVPLKMTKVGRRRIDYGVTDYRLRKRMKMMTPVKEEKEEEKMEVEEEKEEKKMEVEDDELEVVVNPNKQIPVEITDSSTDDDAESALDDNTSVGEEKQKNHRQAVHLTIRKRMLRMMKKRQTRKGKKRLRTLSQAELVAKRDALPEYNVRTTS